jgi:hypothetical protein
MAVPERSFVVRGRSKDGGDHMCRRTAGMALFAFVLAVMATGTARGQANVNENLETATIWVDVVNGNDHNQGTQAEPLKTIKKAAHLAEANNKNGIGTKVTINPGLYRENINLEGISGRDTAWPETFEAATPGTVIITGADQYTNWTQYSGNSNIYSTPWTFNFGLCPPLIGPAPREPDIHLRREMAIIDGVPLEQVLTITQMVEGTFYVDDAGQQFYIWPPSGTNLNTADVELADRGQLWAITRKNGVVLRGLTFEYSADCVGDGAVQVFAGPSQNIEFDTDNFFWNNATGLHLFHPLTNYTVENVVANHNGAVGINGLMSTYGLWLNDTADFNNWRGEQGTYYGWGAAGINNYGNANDSFSNITTDWNAATGFHWDTNLENISATNLNSRSNLYDGVLLERNAGPMNLAQISSCNNANAALLAGGAATTAGGITLRDSQYVTLTNSLMYGNGDSELKVIGIAGGISVLDWQTGLNITVHNQNFTSTGNIMEATDATQAVFRDSYLGGSDWLLFQSTLISNLNTWWNPDNSATPFIVPAPKLRYATDFAGWQTLTLQDLGSNFMQPLGNPQSVCPVTPDMPDFWLISNYPTLTLDLTGHATYTDTVIPLDGFNRTVNLTFGGVHDVPGLSATVTPATIPNASGSAAFTIAASHSIKPGLYQVTVLANSGSTTRTATAFLHVPNTSVRLSTLHLNFPDQLVHTTSAPMTVTMYNIGQSPLSIASIKTSNQVFAYTTTCPSSLDAGKQCDINVTFTPALASLYSQTLTITDSDPTSPQIISLTGTGTPYAEISLSSYRANFGVQVYQTPSAPQTVTATNIGTVPVIFNGYSFSGSNPNDFSDTTDCGQQLDPGDSCHFMLTFTPQALGNRSAAFNIMDNTSNGSNVIQLAGYGLTAVKISPKFLGFGQVEVDTKSAPQTVTLTNSGGILAINGIFLSGKDARQFKQTNTCGSSVPANGSCTIRVLFIPHLAGGKTATLNIEDSDPTSPQTVSLAGIGTN